MIKNTFLLVGFLSIFSCSFLSKRQPQNEPSRWHFDKTYYDIKHPYLANPLVRDVNLRTGYYAESTKTTFKGCVMYLEGLGDSVANHQPLFHHLSDNGYRVVFFDYMGQGGSEGSMNNSRVIDPINESLQISTQAKLVWSLNSLVCSSSKKIVIGWSTGGLVSYKLAREGWADGVVLIAPGIHTKKFVGEAAIAPEALVTLKPIITSRTLTRNQFKDAYDPHIDPIKPDSPMKVPLFAANLLASSVISQHWKIKSQVRGLVFLSGIEDTYVDREATMKTLSKNAPHFKIISYDGALHEIQNEIPEVAFDLYEKTTQFLDAVTLGN